MVRSPVKFEKPRTHGERLDALEERAKVHDKMAEQFGEIYEAWDRLKTLNWFFVKLGAGAGAALGAIAVVLTIADKVKAFLH